MHRDVIEKYALGRAALNNTGDIQEEYAHPFTQLCEHLRSTPCYQLFISDARFYLSDARPCTGPFKHDYSV